MKNIKTTVTGIIAVLIAGLGVANGLMNNTPIDWNATGAALISGIGLIFAKDHNVTGGTVQQ